MEKMKKNQYAKKECQGLSRIEERSKLYGSQWISNTVIKKQILNCIYLSENVQFLEQNINLQSYWKKEKKT